MGLSDEQLKRTLRALRSSRKHAERGDAAAAAGVLNRVEDPELRDTFHRWAKEGRAEELKGIQPRWESSRRRKLEDVAGTAVHIQDTEDDFPRTRKWLIAGLAWKGVPEWSRYNAGGLCLRELAQQCGADWEKCGKHGYVSRLRRRHWYAPSQNKLFMNRHYVDPLGDFAKRELTGTHPQPCALWTPQCDALDMPFGLRDALWREQVHTYNLLLITTDRMVQPGLAKFLTRRDRDHAFLNGLPLWNGPKMPRLFHNLNESRPGLMAIEKGLGGNVRHLAIGVGSHLPDDPNIVFSDKERLLLKEFVWPLVHHAIYLLVSGKGDAAAGEAVQRPPERASGQMEGTEALRKEEQADAREEEQQRRAADRQAAADARALDAEALAAAQQAARGSAVGRFMRQRRAAPGA
eukprot:TRINITY_DN16220_c0_g2_i1.p1 TRINITY_DN16220_c0_g2~~TRINITY_DN16220_c0_g2_i1.p1  ORF type:complete len:406 (+),score=101.02 TRINITY_DN16220_c0_g2_i1:73-1290(+)